MNKQQLVNDPRYIKIVDTIDKEVDYIGLKPYSHNIIGLELSEAAELFGNKVANDLITEFKLEAHGWVKEDDI